MKGGPGLGTPAEVIDYILDCYEGTEDVGRAKAKRQFLWQEGEEVFIGNTVAFLQHLKQRFGVTIGTSTIHKLMRTVGETTHTDSKHEFTGKFAGRYREPAPEVRRVR